MHMHMHIVCMQHAHELAHVHAHVHVHVPTDAHTYTFDGCGFIVLAIAINWLKLYFKVKPWRLREGDNQVTKGEARAKSHCHVVTREEEYAARAARAEVRGRDASIQPACGLLYGWSPVSFNSLPRLLMEASV